MAKFTLKAQTLVGEFNRTTNSSYTHVVVRESSEAMKWHEMAKAGARVSGVDQRWHKDHGYAVTWHGSEKAAKAAAAKPYGYDTKATVIGVFPVDA
jgi:hypothetical protein